MKNLFKIALLFFLIANCVSPLFSFTKDQALNQVLFSSVSNWHFNPKQINDDYSEDVYTLYIKRLDPNKRFFLQEDVTKLELFKTKIDDELIEGGKGFFQMATKIYHARVKETQLYVKDALVASYNFNVSDFIELDADKRKHITSRKDWESYWDKFIKYQILSQYITFLDASISGNVTVERGEVQTINPEIYVKATQKVSENLMQSFERILEIEPDDERALYLDALLNSFDTHTAYFPPERKEDFDISISGKLEGIGAVLREDDGVIKVVRVVAGSAAWRQGDLKAEDTILKVAQATGGEPVSIVGVRVRDAVKLIRGKKGTEVRLTVKRPTGEVLDIPIVRDVVVLEATYAKSSIIEDERYNKKFGFIYLPKFYRDFDDSKGRNTTDDVRKELDKLKAQNVSGVILDLRDNEGGALLDAINTAGLFIKSGPIVQVVGRNRSRTVLRDKDSSVAYSGPLVVMMNVYSASASEILAAALQDYGRAVIVGSPHSFGKGTVQTFVNLDDVYPRQSRLFKPLGSIKLTIQKFYRINGGSTQYKGVTPDIIFPDYHQGLEVGERHLDYSLPWDTVSSLPYSKWESQAFEIDQLRNQSQVRIEKSESFTALKTHLTELKIQRDRTSYPLNLNEAIRYKNSLNSESKKYSEHNDVFSHLKFKSPNLKKLSKDKQKELDGWFEGLSKDIYLDESLSILNDMETL